MSSNGPCSGLRISSGWVDKCLLTAVYMFNAEIHGPYPLERFAIISQRVLGRFFLRSCLEIVGRYTPWLGACTAEVLGTFRIDTDEVRIRHAGSSSWPTMGSIIVVLVFGLPPRQWAMTYLAVRDRDWAYRFGVDGRAMEVYCYRCE